MSPGSSVYSQDIPFHGKSLLLLAIDKEEVVTAVPVLLDLSTAFDAIDHSIFLDWLRSCIRVSGTALHRFESYLENCTQVSKSKL